MALRFRKVLVADERYEAAGVFDVNGDGVPDIVSGAYWYEGPGFRVRHEIGEVKAYGEYYDDFSGLSLDVNGDGRPDLITGGWFGQTLVWKENPGPVEKPWHIHDIARCGRIETTRAWDLDGDGIPEIVPNTPRDPLNIYKLDKDDAGKGLGSFTTVRVYEGPQGHGLGCGDLGGAGRGDLVLSSGWLEAPEDPLSGTWTFHAEFDLGAASVPILVADVNGDGLQDLIVGSAHDYGLDWYEQRRGTNGRREWIRHPVDPWCSQYHDMQWADIDGDGACELVTGKRYRAHCGTDPGAGDAVGLYYFKWNGESFTKQVIDAGPPREGTGCGIHFQIADVNGDGRLDIVAPGKDGLYLFLNEGG